MQENYFFKMQQKNYFEFEIIKKAEFEKSKISHIIFKTPHINSSASVWCLCYTCQRNA